MVVHTRSVFIHSVCWDEKINTHKSQEEREREIKKICFWGNKSAVVEVLKILLAEFYYSVIIIEWHLVSHSQLKTFSWMVFRLWGKYWGDNSIFKMINVLGRQLPHQMPQQSIDEISKLPNERQLMQCNSLVNIMWRTFGYGYCFYFYLIILVFSQTQQCHRLELVGKF